MSDELKFYLDAFFFLSDFRYPGFNGPGPIPFETILTYAVYVGYTGPADQYFFVDVIRACDAVYTTYAREQADRQAKAAKSTSRRH